MHSNISVSDWESDQEEHVLWRDSSTQLYILKQKIHRWIKMCFTALLTPDKIWISPADLDLGYSMIAADTRMDRHLLSAAKDHNNPLVSCSALPTPKARPVLHCLEIIC